VSPAKFCTLTHQQPGVVASLAKNIKIVVQGLCQYTNVRLNKYQGCTHHHSGPAHQSPNLCYSQKDRHTHSEVLMQW